MELLTLVGFIAIVVVLVVVFVAKGTTQPPFIAAADDIVLGTTTPPLSIPMTELRLGRDEQKYHAVIFGRSGSGKSRLLQSVFLQFLNLAKAIGMVEPHHDLSFDTLKYLVSKGFFKDPEAYDKLIYIDWGNGAYVPFNVLAGDRPPHTIALNALDAMLRVWPELAEAPMFQTLFLSGVSALIACGLPITFLYQLITDTEFRRQCLTRVTDPLVHQTFEHYDRLGRDQAQAAGSLLRRCFLLAYSPMARYTLGQPTNVLNFRAMMDQGKAFIINLGNVGDPETLKILGAMLLVQIEQAALSRADLLPSQRTPITVLIDEWASFAAQEETISHLLSQMRKFNLHLWLSGQSLAQVSSNRLVGAIENCKLQIAFGLGRDSAVTQARQIATVDPMVIKEQALTLTQHNQYMTVADQFEEFTQQLQNLEPRYAYVKLEGKTPVCIKTIGMPDADADPDQVAEVLATYRRLYQRTQQEAEEAIAQLSASTPSAVAPNGSTRVAPAYTRVFQHDRREAN